MKNSTYKKRNYALYREIVCEHLGITKTDYNYLRLMGERIGERSCDAAEQYKKKAEKRATALGLNLHYQSDSQGVIYANQKCIH